jgi:hypothetical protein
MAEPSLFLGKNYKVGNIRKKYAPMVTLVNYFYTEHFVLKLERIRFWGKWNSLIIDVWAAQFVLNLLDWTWTMY